MPLLEAKNLEVKMGLQQILFGVSVKVEENSIVAVLGSNGVGKDHPDAGHQRHVPGGRRERAFPRP